MWNSVHLNGLVQKEAQKPDLLVRHLAILNDTHLVAVRKYDTFWTSVMFIPHSFPVPNRLVSSQEKTVPNRRIKIYIKIIGVKLYEVKVEVG